MSVIDWVFTGFIVLLAVRCFVRGFVQEVLSVAAYLVGIFSGLMFSNPLMAFAEKRAGITGVPPNVQYIVAFIISFVVGFLLMRLIEKLVREGLEAANLDIFDKVLGLVLGIGEGLVLVSLALVLMQIQGFFDLSTLLSESLFAGVILPLIGPTVSQTFGSALDTMGNSLKFKSFGGKN